jgi:hypothetical protein
MKIFNFIVESINLSALILKQLLTTPLTNIIIIQMLALKNVVFNFFPIGGSFELINRIQKMCYKNY